MTVATELPATIADVAHLDDLLSTPTPAVVDALSGLDGDLLVLGAGGKMGPTLARMARRALDAGGSGRRVIAVSRFSDRTVADGLRSHGIETRHGDLLDRSALAALPDAAAVVYMAGRKFGSTGDAALTWAMNCHLPALVCERFASSRIVAFSTGNVYGLVPAGSGGSREADAAHPVGEYAMSCLGRERIVEHFSRTRGTAAVLLRLNYATELRYGVLVDLARRIHAGEVVDVTMGYFNVIWQADANAMALASLAHATSPPLVLNIAGPEELTVRGCSEALASAMGRRVSFRGIEAPDAILSNGSAGWTLFGRPRVDAAQVIAWTADWVARGGESLGKPTHFESRDGGF
jgi:nucleoside-diphosphate-sugar epimerase